MANNRDILRRGLFILGGEVGSESFPATLANVNSAESASREEETHDTLSLFLSRHVNAGICRVAPGLWGHMCCHCLAVGTVM